MLKIAMGRLVVSHIEHYWDNFSTLFVIYIDISLFLHYLVLWFLLT